jgi:hypothetical protein
MPHTDREEEVKDTSDSGG